VKALAIRLQLGVPQAINDLRRLAAYRSELAPERFTSLLSQAISDTVLAEAITFLLGQPGMITKQTRDHEPARSRWSDAQPRFCGVAEHVGERFKSPLRHR
jgi:hypothetical protein